MLKSLRCFCFLNQISSNLIVPFFPHNFHPTFKPIFPTPPTPLPSPSDSWRLRGSPSREPRVPACAPIRATAAAGAEASPPSFWQPKKATPPWRSSWWMPGLRRRSGGCGREGRSKGESSVCLVTAESVSLYNDKLAQVILAQGCSANTAAILSSSEAAQSPLVLESEVGGRRSPDSQELIRRPVSAHCRRIHPAVRPAVASACRRRWWACKLLGTKASLLAEGETSAPSLLPLSGTEV